MSTNYNFFKWLLFNFMIFIIIILLSNFYIFFHIIKRENIKNLDKTYKNNISYIESSFNQVYINILKKINDCANNSTIKISLSIGVHSQLKTFLKTKSDYYAIMLNNNKIYKSNHQYDHILTNVIDFYKSGGTRNVVHFIKFDDYYLISNQIIFDRFNTIKVADIYHIQKITENSELIINMKLNNAYLGVNSQYSNYLNIEFMSPPNIYWDIITKHIIKYPLYSFQDESKSQFKIYFIDTRWDKFITSISTNTIVFIIIVLINGILFISYIYYNIKSTLYLLIDQCEYIESDVFKEFSCENFLKFEEFYELCKSFNKLLIHIKNNENKYSLFVKNFNGIVFQAVAGCHPNFIHGSVEKITGYTEEEFLNHTITWRKLIHPDDLPYNLKVLKKLSKTPGFQDNRTYRIISKNKKIKWIRETIHNVLNDNIITFQGVLIDITKEKEKEIILKETRKLSYLGTVVSGIAHEINNPLTGIIQYIELLLESFKKNSEEYEMLSEILESGNRIGTIVKKILQTSHSETEQPNDITFIINESIRFTQSKLNRNNINCKFIFDAPCLVFCDNTFMQMIFTNLIYNSIDAINDCPNNKKEIKIEMFIDNKSNEVTIIFSDTGSGISPENINKIFYPFFTTKHPGKGTGLGMSLTYDIIKELNGFISVKSVKNEWTEFTIIFPIYQGEHYE